MIRVAALFHWVSSFFHDRIIEGFMGIVDASSFYLRDLRDLPLSPSLYRIFSQLFSCLWCSKVLLSHVVLFIWLYFISLILILIFVICHSELLTMTQVFKRVILFFSICSFIFFILRMNLCWLRHGYNHQAVCENLAEIRERNKEADEGKPDISSWLLLQVIQSFYREGFGEQAKAQIEYVLQR